MAMYRNNVRIKNVFANLICEIINAEVKLSRKNGEITINKF